MTGESTPRAVLVVDDEPSMRRVMRTALARGRFQVSEAEGGRRAIEVLHVTPVDLVISDIRMPDGDGVSLLKEIQAGAQPAPRVILLSGFSDLTEDEARRLGAAALLPKPFDFKALLELARTC